MATATLTLCLTLLVILLIKILHNYYKQFKFCRNYPTYSALLPIIGHAYLYFNTKAEDIISRVMEIASCDSKHRKLALVIGNSWSVWYYHPEPVEEILSSINMITKADEYDYFVPWLGRGLLISTQQKWHTRRKLLTPAFHFRILEDAMDVFNTHGRTLADVLGEDSCKSLDNTLDIFPYVTRCTLDIMLESAMGQQLGIQQARHSKYCDTIGFMVHVMQQRQINPMLQNETLFGMSKIKKEYDEALKILKDFTQKVIAEKRASFEESSAPKGKVAFLDLIMQATLPDGSKLSDQDIQEEVDTFMFEGHDTTACAISWSLYLLGKHPQVSSLEFGNSKSLLYLTLITGYEKSY